MLERGEGVRLGEGCCCCWLLLLLLLLLLLGRPWRRQVPKVLVLVERMMGSLGVGLPSRRRVLSCWGVMAR